MTNHRSSANSSNSLNFLDPDVALSLVTVPVLGAIVAGSAIAKAIQTVGVFSEEIFRGDRLPVLDLVDPTAVDRSEQP